jgi:hypothetical protein
MSPEQQGVQAMHAAMVAEREAFGVSIPHPKQRTLIVLQVDNKFQLRLVKLWLWANRVPTFDFREPDYDLGLTATSCFLHPDEFWLLGGLRLWKAN